MKKLISLLIILGFFSYAVAQSAPTKEVPAKKETAPAKKDSAPAKKDSAPAKK